MLLPELSTYFNDTTGASTSIGTANVDLFFGSMPETTGACGCLYEYPGEPPEGRLGNTPTWAYEKPHVQMCVRSSSYTVGRLLIERYFTRAAKLVNRSINDVYYVGADCLQSPFLLKRDENNRWVFAFNMRIEKALSDS